METIYTSILRDIGNNMPVAEWEHIRKNVKNVILRYGTKLPATLYRLEIFHKNKHIGLGKKQVWSIENILRNALKAFPNIRVFFVISRTARHDARRVREKSNGRFRTKIVGTRVPTHVHVGFIGNEAESARAYTRLVYERLKRAGHQNKIGSIGNGEHAINYINYCHRQADSYRQYGNRDFNFKEYIFHV